MPWSLKSLAGTTGLEPATSDVTGRGLDDGWSRPRPSMAYSAPRTTDFGLL